MRTATLQKYCMLSLQYRNQLRLSPHYSMNVLVYYSRKMIIIPTDCVHNHTQQLLEQTTLVCLSLENIMYLVTDASDEGLDV